MDDDKRYLLRRRARQQRLRRLGVLNIRCFCGETDPDCFEPDHVDRRSNSDVVYGICKNCHAKRTARHNSEHPLVGLFPGNLFAGYGHMLLGAADYLEFILDRLRKLADVMFKLAELGIKIED